MAQPTTARTEDSPAYIVQPHDTVYEDSVITRALEILAARVRVGPVLDSPQTLRDYLRVRLCGMEHEVFACIWLDAQHRVLEYEELFRGTLLQTSVYPREVIKRALQVNAAAVIFSHNHPSGVAEPSRADEHLTAILKQVLALVDVRVLDHVIVGAHGCVSFAERGLL